MYSIILSDNTDYFIKTTPKNTAQKLLEFERCFKIIYYFDMA